MRLCLAVLLVIFLCAVYSINHPGPAVQWTPQLYRAAMFTGLETNGVPYEVLRY